MFKKYGVLGLILVILAELNFIFKIEPFASWYFPIIWLGYVLVVDSIVYKLKKDSLISNRPWQIFGMFILSVLFWWIFELLNSSIKNWSYSGMGGFGNTTSMSLFKNLAFSTVLPAFFETVELLRSIHLFDKVKLKKRHNITKKTIYIMWALGILCFILPIIIPQYTFYLVWGTFFFLLDPINYLHKQPSIIQHLKDRKFTIPLSLFAAGLIMGFFWEFWNYWSVRKWVYNVPYVGFWKIFEMPLLGYLGYLPFAFELYAMYWFTRSLFVHKEHLLVK